MATTWPTSPPSGVENTYNITSNTDVRDVSDVLDSMYLADTPIINKIGWGSSASNTIIEWVTDSIGTGYIIVAGDVASNVTNFVALSSGCGSVANAVRQVHTGTVLKYNGNTSNEGSYLIVQSLSTGGGSIVFAWLSGTQASGAVALSANNTLFIVGSPAAQGSSPRADSTRQRALESNKMQIFRQDVRMTGTRMATKMYAVGNELRKQIELRTMEYKRELERTVILGKADTGSATETQLMDGLYTRLFAQSGNHIDKTTTILNESALNTVCAEIYERGGSPNCLVLGPKQARVIPTFDRARVRMAQSDRMAGYYVNKYMTDLGVELDILISRWVPSFLGMVLDTTKLKLRPMEGRKFTLEKLAKTGDFINYQLISECSLEMMGMSHGCHGLFEALT